MRKIMPVFIALFVVGCTAQQIDAFNNATNNAIVQGQLFCAKATATGPLIVAVVSAASGTEKSSPVIATNATATFVSNVCSGIGAIPVAPPNNTANVPVIAVKIP